MYRVFQKNPVTNEWRNLGEFEGANQSVAINAAGGGNDGEEFFAMPSRSYHPVKFERVEVTRTRMVASEAGDDGDEEEA